MPTTSLEEPVTRSPSSTRSTTTSSAVSTCPPPAVRRGTSGCSPGSGPTGRASTYHSPRPSHAGSPPTGHGSGWTAAVAESPRHTFSHAQKLHHQIDTDPQPGVGWPRHSAHNEGVGGDTGEPLMRRRTPTHILVALAVVAVLAGLGSPAGAAAPHASAPPGRPEGVGPTVFVGDLTVQQLG